MRGVLGRIGGDKDDDDDGDGEEAEEEAEEEKEWRKIRGSGSPKEHASYVVGEILKKRKNLERVLFVSFRCMARVDWKCKNSISTNLILNTECKI